MIEDTGPPTDYWALVTAKHIPMWSTFSMPKEELSKLKQARGDLQAIRDSVEKWTSIHGTAFVNGERTKADHHTHFSEGRHNGWNFNPGSDTL